MDNDDFALLTVAAVRDAEAAAFHRALLAAPCPECGAPPGARCVNPVTGAPYRFGEHWRRARASAA